MKTEIIRARTAVDMAAVRQIRSQVFILEQQVPPELEWDELEERAVHVLCRRDGAPAAAGRLVVTDGRAKIGRVAVLKRYRGQGLGAAVCRKLIEIAHDEGAREIYLNAQLHARGFYEKLGFTARGEIFEEAGIDHMRMVYDEPCG